MLNDNDIISILKNELDNSIKDVDYVTPLSYYLGNPLGNEIEGRSKVISTDVADAIEWIMPQIMKSFTQNNEIVIFDPVSKGDEQQAELESQFVYEVLMKQNDGFIIIHQFVKDALMQKNGILKVYYAKKTNTKISEYTGINELQLNSLISSDQVEILEKTDYVDEYLTQQKQNQIQLIAQQNGMTPELQAEMNKPVMLFDIKVAITREKGKVYVESVPIEDFRVNSNHNSISLDSARFTSHVTKKTIGEISSEYSLTKDEISKIPLSDTDNNSAYRKEEQGESSINFTSLDKSMVEVDVSESYIMIDIDEIGIPKYMKICAIGGDDPTFILDKEEIDASPWISTTAFLMSHKFFGLSIFDRLKQIQEQKTSLWRNILDNMYFQNNQRLITVENQVNLDDLLISRPGGIIRARNIDAVKPLVVPDIGNSAYQMMDYLDRVRAGRTGVDPDGNATPTNIGDRVGSQGVERLFNAKEELVGLIIRVIAETGVKPLCIKIRDLCIKHFDASIDYKFRDEWYNVRPSLWNDRSTTTVRVGTGTGNHTAKLAAINQVMAIQEKVLSNPNQSILNENKVYLAIDDFCKFSGLNGADRYFIDPNSDEGKNLSNQVQQNNKNNSQKQDEMQRIMLKAQVDISNAALQEAQSKMDAVRYKAIAEQSKQELDKIRDRYDSELSLLKQQLEEAKAIAAQMGKDAEIEFKYADLETRAALELTRIEAEKDKELNKQYTENKAGAGDE